MIGNSLKLSPNFPPRHTVHETFTSHGVPSAADMLLTGAYPYAVFPQLQRYCGSAFCQIKTPAQIFNPMRKGEYLGFSLKNQRKTELFGRFMRDGHHIAAQVFGKGDDLEFGL